MRVKITSAWLKKMRKRFKRGDVVTWGVGRTHHEVISVERDGVVVDSDGPHFVSWNGYSRRKGTPGTMDPKRTLRHATGLTAPARTGRGGSA